MWVSVIARHKQDGGLGLAIPEYDSFAFMVSTVLIMTTGTVFLMWIGEQIDEYGIGNGISLLIMAGIVARIPDATYSLFFERGHLKASVFMLGGSGTGGDVGLEADLEVVGGLQVRAGDHQEADGKTEVENDENATDGTHGDQVTPDLRSVPRDCRGG